MDLEKEETKEKPGPKSAVGKRSVSSKSRVKYLIKHCIETLLEIGRELDVEEDDFGSIISSLESIDMVTEQVESKSECSKTGSTSASGGDHHGGFQMTEGGEGVCVDEDDVKGNQGDCLEDLPTSHGHGDDNPLSKKKYFQLSSFEKGYEKMVTIETVESPDHIVVNLAGDGGNIGQMIQSFYSSVKPEPLHYVEIDQPCLIESKKVYSRGKVVDIDKEMVQVLLVDKGTIEVKHKSSLFEINDRFLDITEMSLVVKLAGVRPMSCSTSWSVASTRTLRDRIEGMEFLMFVQEDRQDRSLPLSVILYENFPKKDVCINFWLASIAQAKLSPEACMRLEYFRPAVPSSHPGENSSRTETDTSNTFSARVVGIKSPSCIVIRSLNHESDQERLQQALQQHFKSRGSFNTFRKNNSVPSPGEFVGVFLRSNQVWVRGKVEGIFDGKATVQLIDFFETEEVRIEDLRPLPSFLKLGSFTESVHLTRVTPPSLDGNWSREATEYLDKLIQENGNKVEVKCLGKSANKLIPVKMMIFDEKEAALSDVEDKLVAAGLAVSLEEVRPEVGIRAELESEDWWEVAVLQWSPAVPFIPGNLIKAAVATHVDWDGFVHLVEEPRMLEVISNLLRMQYSGSVARPVDKYWSVGEAAVVESEYYGGWYRVVVLEVLEDVQLCKVRFVDYGNEEFIPFKTMRKDLFTSDIPVQTFMLRIDIIQPKEGVWKKEDLDILHELLVDKTFNVLIEEVKGNGEHYVGSLSSVEDGRDMGTIIQSNFNI